MSSFRANLIFFCHVLIFYCRFLKEQDAGIKVVLADPPGSSLLHKVFMWYAFPFMMKIFASSETICKVFDRLCHNWYLFISFFSVFIFLLLFSYILTHIPGAVWSMLHPSAVRTNRQEAQVLFWSVSVYSVNLVVDKSC